MKSVDVFTNMKSVIERLHEHERLMDKAYFEELVKSDTFLIRGQVSSNKIPVTWVRD